MKFWLDKGVDGFRCDMANSIVKKDINGKGSCEVWNKLFNEVRKEYKNAIFISEWGQPKYSVGNDAFDIDFFTHFFNEGYNHLFRNEKGSNVLNSNGNSFFRKEGLGEANTFFNYLKENLNIMNDKGYISIVTGNHDLPRISYNRNDDELKCAYAFILSLPCIPLIYYGDEVGMSYYKGINKDGGYNRTGSRTPMQWGSDNNAGFSKNDNLYLPINEDYIKHNVETMKNDDNSLLNTLIRLCKIRKENSEFDAGCEYKIISSNYPLIIERKSKENISIIYINPSNNEYNFNIDGKILISNNSIYCNKNLKMKGQSFAWIKNK